jgi:hypothetical protein
MNENKNKFLLNIKILILLSYFNVERKKEKKLNLKLDK